MDYEGDCTPYYRARFTYDHHLHYSDAFAGQVQSVALYAFDDEGRYVAWCGLEDERQSHAVPTLQPGTSTLSDLTCTVQREHADGTTATAGELAPAFHSLVTDVELTDTYGTHYIDIPLVKDTKTVRVVLQHLDGSPVPADRFTFNIACANGLMAHDNSLLPDEVLNYRPYYTASGTAETQADGTRATTSISTALAEMSTGRLVWDNGTPATLSVTNNETGQVCSPFRSWTTPCSSRATTTATCPTRSTSTGRMSTTSPSSSTKTTVGSAPPSSSTRGAWC